jgi:ParB family chromosome partitioning protein
VPHSRRGAPHTGKVTAASPIKSYENEAQRQRLLVKKADLAQTRLSFVINALRRLLADEQFLTLLAPRRCTRCRGPWPSSSN